MLNCHQNTETADFLGSLRPVRGKEAVLARLEAVAAEAGLSHVAPADLPAQLPADHPQRAEVQAWARDYAQLFAWYDGPLVEAMKAGGHLLVDEISLAEDAVLERLNSVLEPSRTLFLAEKGGAAEAAIVAVDDFRLLATMNPGGDFGKKELSPALRNRFTEVWVPALEAADDLLAVTSQRLLPALHQYARPLCDFLAWLRTLPRVTPPSLRDLLAWVGFLNQTAARLPPPDAFVHGACLVFLDGVGSGSMLSEAGAAQLRQQCLDKLYSLLPAGPPADLNPVYTDTPELFGIAPFLVARTGGRAPAYTFTAPTTTQNVLRILRALELNKAVLLEGSPGVGKTTLVTALAEALGRPVVRINLSEQTDMMDLLGSDLPVEGGRPGQFAWRDGVFLQALQRGHWVLLDELNLASQSVLEGLNAVLDHRQTVFIPELGREFVCAPGFRIFACQNPTQQGGGRKGLPKSFLNRFTQVYVRSFQAPDLLHIMQTSFPGREVGPLVAFNQEMHQATMVTRRFGGRGSPWEFNLRDLFRWAELLEAHPGLAPADFLPLLYISRMRTLADRAAVQALWEAEAGPLPPPQLNYRITGDELRIGRARLPRKQHFPRVRAEHRLLHHQLPLLEQLMFCVGRHWMPILIGESGSGKSSAVRLLAELAGHELHEFAMNSAVDTTELLGSYEQLDLPRHLAALVDALDAAVWQCTRRLPGQDLQDLHTALHALRQLPLAAPAAQTSALLTAVFALLSGHSGRHSLGLDLAPLQAQAAAYQRLSTEAVQGRFEWVDGLLLRALERGDWVIIENVNFCPSAVLDRLNPLLEPGGTLAVNERGLLDGEVRLVRPHPDFRLFLTMDPRNGEISRAMRNRGVELCLLDGPDRWDRRALLVSVGVPGPAVAERMMEVADELGPGELAWGRLLRELLERGTPLAQALPLAGRQVYPHFPADLAFPDLEPRLIAAHLYPYAPRAVDFQAAPEATHLHLTASHLYARLRAASPPALPRLTGALEAAGEALASAPAALVLPALFGSLSEPPRAEPGPDTEVATTVLLEREAGALAWLTALPAPSLLLAVAEKYAPAPSGRPGALLAAFLFSRAREQATYQAAERQAQVGRLSAVQQLHLARSRALALNVEKVAFAILPFLDQLDAMLLEQLRAGAEPHHLLTARHAFWQLLAAQPAFAFPAFLAGWLFLRRFVQREASAVVQAAALAIDRACGDSPAPAALWKAEPRPAVMRTPELLDLALSLRQTAARLTSSFLGPEPLFRPVDPAARKDLADALCSLEYLNEATTDRSAPAAQDLATMLSAVAGRVTVPAAAPVASLAHAADAALALQDLRALQQQAAVLRGAAPTARDTLAATLPLLGAVALQQLQLAAETPSPELAARATASLTYAWHEGLWTGGFNSTPLAGAEVWAGPARLLTATQTAVVARLLQDWAAVPISLVEGKARQVAALASQVERPGPAYAWPAVPAELQSLAAATLAPYAGQVDGSDWSGAPAPLQRLQSLWEQLPGASEARTRVILGLVRFALLQPPAVDPSLKAHHTHKAYTARLDALTNEMQVRADIEEVESGLTTNPRYYHPTQAIFRSSPS